MDLETLEWDQSILEELGIPRSVLPEIRGSSEVYGAGVGDLDGVPIAGILGDQHAALFGQTCFEAGQAKCTYGTGAFMLMHTGTTPVHSTHGLITTVAARLGRRHAGNLRTRGLGRRRRLPRPVAARRPRDHRFGRRDRGACPFRTRFGRRRVRAGLLRPVRAALAARRAGHHRRADAVLDEGPYRACGARGDGVPGRRPGAAMAADLGAPLPGELRVDGGMTRNELLMQIQADILGSAVLAPAITEITALGAAFAAGLAVGFWRDLDELRSIPVRRVAGSPGCQNVTAPPPLLAGTRASSVP